MCVKIKILVASLLDSDLIDLEYGDDWMFGCLTRYRVGFYYQACLQSSELYWIMQFPFELFELCVVIRRLMFENCPGLCEF